MHKAFFVCTELPKKIIESIEEDLIKFDSSFTNSYVGRNNNILDKEVRNSKNAWIPSSHWISGFIWHYVQVANQKNFLFDIDSIDGDALQYTVYEEGSYYNWHCDDSFKNLYIPQCQEKHSTNPHTDERFNDFINVNLDISRKISFSLQLSDPEDYKGGELQIMNYDGTTFFCPKDKGTLVLFDSRTMHRVRKIKSGLRKSIVGWVIGKRWR